MTFKHVRTIKTLYNLKTKSGTYGKKISVSIPKNLTEAKRFDVYFDYETESILIKPTKEGDNNE